MALFGTAKSVRPLALAASVVLVGGLSLAVTPEASAVTFCGGKRQYTWGWYQACIRSGGSGSVAVVGYLHKSVAIACKVNLYLFDVGTGRNLGATSAWCFPGTGTRLFAGPSRSGVNGTFRAGAQVGVLPLAYSPDLRVCPAC